MSQRRKPYTVRGISRVTCAKTGCRKRGFASWQVCANDRAFHVLCWECDIAMNRQVLTWMGDPDLEEKMARYTIRVMHNAGVWPDRPQEE